MDRLGDRMVRDLVVIASDRAVRDAIDRMEDGGLRHLPVVDGEGRLVGVLTDLLLLQAVGMHGYEAVSHTPLQKMVQPAPTAAADEPLIDVLQRMLRLHADHLVVVDDQRRPVGLFTEHDAVNAAIGLIDASLTAKHEATWTVHSVSPSTTAAKALAKMLELRIRHLVVVDHDRLVGVLSVRDLVGLELPPGPTCGSLVTDRHPVTVPAGAGLRKIASLMVEHRIGCVPIIHAHDRHVLGLVTRRDAMASAIRGLEEDDLFPST